MTENIWFRPEELKYFDSINAEVPSLVAPRAKYFMKILAPVTTDGRFEKDTLYGEQKRNWKFAGPLTFPVYMEAPQEPKETEENRGGNLDMQTRAVVSRKLFEESVPEDLANILIAVRGAIIPNAGDVMLIWTTHEGDIASWDVESIEREGYLGDMPLHLHWTINLQRRSRYDADRSFGQSLEAKDPIVIITPEEFEYMERSKNLKPVTPAEGKIDQKFNIKVHDQQKRALGG